MASVIRNSSNRLIRKCTIRYGTSLTPTFVKDIDVLPPSQADFDNAKLVAPTRISETDNSLQLRRPSLSAVLGSIDDRKALYLWQKQMIEEMGLSEFRKASTERMKMGIRIHSRIEKMLKVRGDPKFEENNLMEIIKEEKEVLPANYLKSVVPFLINLERANEALSEKRTRHPLLAYQGRFDAILFHKGEWHIVDWKTAQARSSLNQQGEESLTFVSYARQLAAYASAFNSDISFINKPVVRKGLLVSLKEDGKEAEVFEISETDMQRHFEDVRSRLIQFWDKISSAESSNIDFAYKPPN